MFKLSLISSLLVFSLLGISQTNVVIVKDINEDEESSLSIQAKILVENGIGYFSADDGIHGQELWRTDGTSDGTFMIKNIATGESLGVTATPMCFYDEYCYFGAYSLEFNSELWKSDGTEAGTVLVKDVNEMAFSNEKPTPLLVYQNELYFTADNGINGVELWKTDGSSEGTSMVFDIKEGEGDSSPRIFVIYNNLLYFFAKGTNVEHFQLWKTDGTSEGTELVHNLAEGEVFEYPQQLTVCYDKLYFTASAGIEGGREPWISDGTTEGTHVLKILGLGELDGTSRFFTEFQDKTYFTSTGNLWHTDGTIEGTQIFGDTNNPIETGFSKLVVFNDRLILNADLNDGLGNELYFIFNEDISLLKDFKSGFPEGNPRQFLKREDNVVFVVNDDVLGEELYRTDGTIEGTVRISTISTGFNGTSIQMLTDFEDKVLFSSVKPHLGRELYQCTNLATSVEDDNIEKNDIYITPNPSSGIFYIASQLEESGFFRIFNNQGKVLIERPLKFENKIDLSSYPAGVYYFSSFNDNEVLILNRKLVKS